MLDLPGEGRVAGLLAPVPEVEAQAWSALVLGVRAAI